MRRFTDDHGVDWEASVAAEAGGDYKGRYYLALRRLDRPGEEPVTLADVRWNSRKTAARTMNTMSAVELRRRLRSALGRAGSASTV